MYIQRPGEGEAEIREHFRTMKALGFTSLKQFFPISGWTSEQLAMIALDEGIIPWWYGEAGWEAITDELLDQLAIPRNTDIAAIRTHPKMVAYQTARLRDRVKRLEERKQLRQTIKNNSTVPPLGNIGPNLPEETRSAFAAWAKKQYPTIERLNNAYSLNHALQAQPFQSWEDFEGRRLSSRNYRYLRDIFRFKADMKITSIRERMEQYLKFDPHEPLRAGGEMGMFLPFAYRGVDMEGIAELIKDYGSFYPSIHLAWHFDEVEHEIVRPIYMQAALTHDYFKGGWSATWESTGGPQQLSGGKGGNGFTVDQGTMTQLMLSYLAAGYKGFGLWAWSARTAGWEAGEFTLLDRHNQVTPRAIRAGQIGKTARKYRDELWKARKEPLVGVYAEWDNEAIWAAISVRGRDKFRQLPIDARVGVSRALINGNVPYEYVTASDLRKGLAHRYKIIYLPFVIAMNQDVMEILSDYVREGGRLVIDMPSAWYDENGALMSTDVGTTFEKTFGTTINSYQYAGVNIPVSLEQLQLNGFTVDITPTSAKVLTRYDNGKPAITENNYGKGTAVLLGYEASKTAFKPGNKKAERMLLDYTLGDYESPYQCETVICYRIAAPEADHYFLLNDQPKTTAFLDTKNYNYTRVIDAVTGEELQLNQPIEVEGYSGRWLRFEKESD
ncbi:beta-galactosidase trimerization domain-containing protein [Crocosphaera sp.]|uniref:beta-galactosidase trimerization domain-containing protein n=1 Tax=Crocosphaera sp. TaxID=2729996 RepID=UPI003F29791B